VIQNPISTFFAIFPPTDDGLASLLRSPSPSERIHRADKQFNGIKLMAQLGALDGI
jgi:hypothetical protein